MEKNYVHQEEELYAIYEFYCFKNYLSKKQGMILDPEYDPWSTDLYFVFPAVVISTNSSVHNSHIWCWLNVMSIMMVWQELWNLHCNCDFKMVCPTAGYQCSASSHQLTILSRNSSTVFFIDEAVDSCEITDYPDWWLSEFICSFTTKHLNNFCRRSPGRHSNLPLKFPTGRPCYTNSLLPYVCLLYWLTTCLENPSIPVIRPDSLHCRTDQMVHQVSHK